MIRLAIVEDDKEECKLLAHYLRKYAEFEEIVIAHSVEELLPLLQSGFSPDIILQDIALPGLSGIEAIPEYRKRIPKAKILINSHLQTSDIVYKAIRAGALGYIEKGYTIDQIKEAIVSIYNGGCVLSPGVAHQVITFFTIHHTVEELLTPKETEIVQSIREGLSYKLIANKHHISLDTVRTHIMHIYRKLHINSKGELLSKYQKL